MSYETKPVNVIECLHMAETFYRNNGFPGTADGVAKAADAVAELIEAANGVIASYRFESPDPCEVLVKVDQDTLLRMCAAVANVGNAP
jgi:hypothetical protein